MKEIERKQLVEKTTRVYVACDGKEFYYREECIEYENRVLVRTAMQVEHCEEIRRCPNFNGSDAYDEHDYIWYHPKSVEDCELLEKAYGDYCKDFKKCIGKWICVEIGYDGVGSWLSTLDDGIEYARNILDKLGYRMEVHKK